MLKRLLIANRGEIALRVVRAAEELGIETVGIFAPGDGRSIHLPLCDRTERLDSDDPAGAYLDIEAILAAAKRAGADSLHPGYGFLSESPTFARRVEQEGLVFVGPLPETMETFGVKTGARALVKEAGVPTVPGSDGPVESAEAALGAADRLGYPVMLKASHGGGGRGIRAVAEPSAMGTQFETATAEAKQAFGNGELYLEKRMARPRHIEVQVVGDGRGGAVHFFERDCSMQRRNQKLIEESPAANLAAPLRAKILDGALRAARAGRYRSAGTVEFLVVGEQHYFLEVNARLQVEHPVTEAVTGVDLVRLQLELAGGEGALPSQAEVALQGAAIECRINAEDPRANFLPSPGRILNWQVPSGGGVRVDAGGYAGGEVSPLYDSLLAKLIVHAPSRSGAIDRALRALGEFDVAGVPTTIPFHRLALQSAPFQSGRYDTATVGELGLPPPPPEELTEAAVVASLAARLLRAPPSAGPAARAPFGGERPDLRTPFGPRGSGWFHEV